MMNLATALIKAQAEFRTVPQSGNNPFHKSKYSTLKDCWDTARPVLAKHGLGNVDGLDQYVYRRHDQASVELPTGGHHHTTPCPRDERVQAPKVLETSALSPRFRC